MTQTILITGGSRGIGRAAAILCGERGWSVGINYAGNAAAAEETVQAVEQAGGKAMAVKGDVSSEADVVAMFAATARAFCGKGPERDTGQHLPTAPPTCARPQERATEPSPAQARVANLAPRRFPRDAGHAAATVS